MALLKFVDSALLSKTAASTSGYIHSVDSCGTVDGPGVRFVVFTTGCPLRCMYCHNPDARYVRDGTKRSLDSLLDEIATYSDFINRAGGGLTVSGGEPLMQAEFVAELFKGAKERYGLHTALDTSGHSSIKQADKVLPYADLVLLDIKSWDRKTYFKVTSRSKDKCIAFARHLNKIKKPAWIRYVLVPGLTDAEENLQGLSNFLGTLDNIERIEILPFHKMGEYKWEALKYDYKLQEVNPPTAEQIEQAKSILESSGHTVLV